VRNLSCFCFLFLFLFLILIIIIFFFSFHSLSGRPPFYDDNPNVVLKKVKSGKFEFPDMEWAYVSDDGMISFPLRPFLLLSSFHFASCVFSAKDLIRNCIVRDPNQRVDIHEFLRHPWMAVSRHTSFPSLTSVHEHFLQPSFFGILLLLLLLLLLLFVARL